MKIALMYHSILESPQDVPPEREVGADIYDVRLDDFRKQMQMLDELGFHVTADLRQEHPKTCVITFDDGEMNNYVNALPVLSQLGYPALFFLIVGRIGKPGYMGWNELKELQKSGMVIGSHGLSHEILTNLLDTQVEQELKASKRTLELNLGTEIDTLSIPRGYCNQKVIQMAYDCGYKEIFISDQPRGGLSLKCRERFAVRKNMGLVPFRRALLREQSRFYLLKDKTKRTVRSLLPESLYNFFRNLLIRLLR